MNDITQQQQADQGEAQERDAPETIRLAKDMGWKDPAEWQGEPPKNGFVSASEFVRRSEKILPIVNARARAAEERASKLEAKLEQMERDHRDNLRRIERMSDVALKNQRQQIEAQYSERIEAAAKVGDTAAVAQARKDEKEALKAIDEKLEPSADEKKQADLEKAKLPAPVQAVVDAWKADNPWFKDEGDDEMSMVAMRHHMRLQKEKRGLTLAENLAEVTKYIRKRYPEEFSTGDEETGDEGDDPPLRRGSRVEGGSRSGGGGGGGTKFSKLPADAKAQADKFIKEDGLFLLKGETAEKNLAAARERYAAKFLEE